ncbi:MAG: DUF1211 domain-containing protein [Chitinophagaceae bacterium]|nr:DUF1211 domain-containing protein [Chitinophagaceae bacterium]
MLSHYNKIAGKDTGRSIAIADGVFGVALTLLVLDVRVPIMDGIHSDKQLIDAFLDLGPKFLVSFLAFMTGGIFWMGHSAQYKHITGSDRNLSWINLLFLLTVIMLPFTTSFLGNYVEFKFPIAVYWLNIFLMGAILYIHWAYAYKHNFVNEETREIVNKPLRTRIIIAQSLYFLGLLMCFISPYLSIGFIIAVQLNYAFGLISGPKS